MHQFTIHPSSHHPSSNFQHAKNLRKESAKICEKLIITSPHHHIIPSSNFQLPACKKSARNSSPHHHITSFFLISGFSSTKFSGVRLGIKRSERSNISTKKARYNNIIIGFCSERTEYKLKG